MKFRTYEISGNDFVEAQTKRIADEFKSSRPSPRGYKMGFKRPAKKPRKY